MDKDRAQESPTLRWSKILSWTRASQENLEGNETYRGLATPSRCQVRKD